MKKSLLIFLGLSMSCFLMAQESVKQKEIGLVFYNLDNFGLTYKIGTEKSLWRFNTLFLSGSNVEETTDMVEKKSKSMGFGIKFGKEFRKDIVEDLAFRYGIDLSFNYQKSKLEYDPKPTNSSFVSNERTTYRPGINLVFGLNYAINDKIVIGGEILPGFTYISGEITEKRSNGYNVEETKTDLSGFNYGLSTGSVLLSIVYRL
jgi:hypothetical protein